MSDHVTPASHPELTEAQRAEVNDAAVKWCFTEFGQDHAPSPFFTTEKMRIRVSAYKYAVERIVAEVTA